MTNTHPHTPNNQTTSPFIFAKKTKQKKNMFSRVIGLRLGRGGWGEVLLRRNLSRNPRFKSAL